MRDSAWGGGGKAMGRCPRERRKTLTPPQWILESRGKRNSLHQGAGRRRIGRESRQQDQTRGSQARGSTSLLSRESGQEIEPPGGQPRRFPKPLRNGAVGSLLGPADAARPHSPAHGPKPTPAAGVLCRNSVLEDHFRIRSVSRK